EHGARPGPQLGGGLDRDDPIPRRDERGKDVEERGLAGPARTSNDDIETVQHASAQEKHRFLRDAVPVYELLGREDYCAELSDREDRACERQRRDYGVHAGSVREASGDRRRRLVAASPERGDE